MTLVASPPGPAVSEMCTSVAAAHVAALMPMERVAAVVVDVVQFQLPPMEPPLPPPLVVGHTTYRAPCWAMPQHTRSPATACVKLRTGPNSAGLPSTRIHHSSAWYTRMPSSTARSSAPFTAYGVGVASVMCPASVAG